MRPFRLGRSLAAGSHSTFECTAGALPDESDALFLHDLALHPDIAGTGQAGAIVDQIAAEAQAAGFDDIALVAVNDTAGFWERRGFTIAGGPPNLRAKLATYGEGARYMRRHLANQLA